MLFGTTPGMTCKCSWATLSPGEFKQNFGISFWRFRRLLNKQPATYAFAKSHSFGNAKQRRTYRREQIRALNLARQSTEAI